MALAETTAFRQVLVLCAVAVVPAVAVALWHPRWPERVVEAFADHEVTIAAVRTWSDPILWIDARPGPDYGRGHVPGALPLEEAQWERELPAVLEAWRPEMKVVVYCAERGCAASDRVARRLRKDLGHEGVYFLRGGFEAWRTAHK